VRRIRLDMIDFCFHLRILRLGIVGRGIGFCSFQRVSCLLGAVLLVAVAAALAAVGRRGLRTVVLIFLAQVFLGLCLQQGLTVGNGNLVVVGMNFAEGKETMAIAAIFDERGLERWFDARY